MGIYSLVFAKNTSASRYFAGVLTKFSAHGGILGKDEGVNVAAISRRHFPRQDERIVKAVEALDAKALFDAEFYQTVGGAPFPETTARNIASYQVDFSQSRIYSAALIATSTLRNRYEPGYLTKLKHGSIVL